jgi:hypothetical protein
MRFNPFSAGQFFPAMGFFTYIVLSYIVLVICQKILNDTMDQCIQEVVERRPHDRVVVGRFPAESPLSFNKWPIFGRFLTLFPLKCPARREKNTSNMADVRR